MKEPVTLFQKSRGRRPQCHGVSDLLSRHTSVWVVEVWSKHGLKWLQECAFTRWHLISHVCFICNSAIGCKWGRLALFICFSVFFTKRLCGHFFTDSHWVFHFEVFFTHVAISCFVLSWALIYIFKQATPKKRHLIKQFLFPYFISI